MLLPENVYKLMKEEILNDPYSLGYSGKTDTEIAKLMNEPFTKQVTVDEYHSPRITEIINAVPNLPNVITAQDVATAKAMVIIP